MNKENNTAWITSCKSQDSGDYLVNGNVSVPNDPANRQCADVIQWIAGGNTVDPEYTDAELLVNAHAEAKSSIVAKATQTRSAITGNADHYKVSGWVQKSLLAKKVVDEVATPTELAVVQSEADQRGKGETALELSETVVAKGAQLAMAIANIDGMESAVLRALGSCKTVEHINGLLSQANEGANTLLAKLGL